MRWLLAGVFPAIVAAVALAQQKPLAFEVASVKENTSVGQAGRLSGPTPGRYTSINVPLFFLLQEAFGLRDHQLVNLPDWADARFDINATYPQGLTPTIENTREMLRTLLADRFHLVTHRETRELETYVLVMVRRDGRLGPQLVRSDVDCGAWLAEKRPQVNAGAPSALVPGGRRHECFTMGSRRFVVGGTQTMAQLGTALQSLVRRPVIDRTGLSGAFNFDLSWEGVPTNAPPAGGLPPGDVAAIFTALQDQLGLRLESSRAPFDVVVVDAVRRPTPD